jgi:hypothetical protein
LAKKSGYRAIKVPGWISKKNLKNYFQDFADAEEGKYFDLLWYSSECSENNDNKAEEQSDWEVKWVPLLIDTQEKKRVKELYLFSQKVEKEGSRLYVYDCITRYCSTTTRFFFISLFTMGYFSIWTCKFFEVL